MDEYLRKFQEKMQEREHEADLSLMYIDYYWSEKLGIGYKDILEYGWQLGHDGVCKLICKEKFINEYVDEKMQRLDVGEFV